MVICVKAYEGCFINWHQFQMPVFVLVASGTNKSVSKSVPEFGW